MLIMAALLAGVVTTLAGMGGGTLLVLVVAWWSGDPLQALSATSLGLLAGNAHRTWMYRRSLHWRTVAPFALGAFPAAVFAGWLVISLPTAWLKLLIAAFAAVAVAGVVLGWRIRPRPQAAVATGAVVGSVSATTGGGGILAGPFFLATGLTGESYIVTAAVGAVAVHVGRLIGYGGGGAINAEVLWLGLGFGVAIPVGNLIGKRLRPFLSKAGTARLEQGVAALLAALALVNAV